MTQDELKNDIKKMIIEALQIKDVSPEQIEDDVLLFENPLLGLDSLDSLELVVALQKKYGVAIRDENQAIAILQTVNSIADFISASQSAA